MNATLTRCQAEVLQVLDEEVLSTSDRWTKDRYARDANGFEIGVDDELAVSFCILGARYKALQIWIQRTGHYRGCYCNNLFSEVGLTAIKNDYPETTFEDIKARIAVLRACPVESEE